MSEKNSEMRTEKEIESKMQTILFELIASTLHHNDSVVFWLHFVRIGVGNYELLFFNSHESGKKSNRNAQTETLLC